MFFFLLGVLCLVFLFLHTIPFPFPLAVVVVIWGAFLPLFTLGLSFLHITSYI